MTYSPIATIHGAYNSIPSQEKEIAGISKMFNTELCESMFQRCLTQSYVRVCFEISFVEREKIPEKIWDQLGFVISQCGR